MVVMEPTCNNTNPPLSDSSKEHDSKPPTPSDSPVCAADVRYHETAVKKQQEFSHLLSGELH